jgi:hypothetical protein
MIAEHLDEQRLVALGLGEAPTPAEAEHLAACPACAAVPAEDARLWASFRQLDQPLPPASFAAGALARFRLGQRLPVRHRPRDIALGAVLGLAVVLVLALWLRGVAPGALVAATLWLSHWNSPLPRGSRRRSCWRGWECSCAA